jgi:hypothetical protein
MHPVISMMTVEEVITTTSEAGITQIPDVVQIVMMSIRITTATAGVEGVARVVIWDLPAAEEGGRRSRRCAAV